MRPLTLTLSAFESFTETVSIDMDQLGREGLYLITGDTGAGKTTIFDGICFALYGQASGEDREPDMLRSKYAAADTPTEIRMTFEHNNKIYTIRRNPTYERPAKRGLGMTTEKAAAELTEPDGRVTVRLEDVNKRIEELLGINYRQFTQIVMLAQGAFMNFLNADTKERQQIFGKFFQTENFKKLSDKVGEESRKAGQEADRLSRSIEQYIQGIACSAEDPLIEEVEKAKGSSLTVSDTMQLIEQLIARDTEAEKKLTASIEGCDTELKDLHTRIDKARERENSLLSLQKNRDVLKALEDSCAAAETARKAALAELDRKEGLTSQATTVRNQLAVYEELSRNEKELAGTVNRIGKLQTDIRAAEDALAKGQTDLAKDKAELQSLQNAGEDRARLEIMRAEAKNSMEEMLKLDQRFVEVDKDCENARAAAAQYLQAEQAYEEKLGQCNEAEKKLRRSQAGLLARGLEENTPCPVCGSLHHPDPARITEGAPTEEEVDDLRKDTEKLRISAGDKSKASGAAAEKAKSGMREIKAAAGEMLGDPDLAAGEQDSVNDGTAGLPDVNALNLVKKRLRKLYADKMSVEKQAEDGLSRIKQMSKRRDALNSSIPNQEGRLNALNGNITAMKAEKAGAEAKRDSLKSVIDKSKGQLRYSSLEEAKKAVESFSRQAETLQQNFDRAAAAYGEASNKLASQQGAVKKLEESIEGMPQYDLAELEQRQTGKQEEKDGLSGRRGELQIYIHQNSEALKNIRTRSCELEGAEKNYRMLLALDRTVNGNIVGKDKVNLETYIQMNYFNRVLERANVRLLPMSSGQFELVRARESVNKKSLSGLDINVIDHYNNSTERSVKSLSGGEKFMASLSLALGFSDEIMANAGGIRVDTMFVDEGFGTLDADTLDTAYRALADVSSGGKCLIGIISHVEDLRNRIDKIIEVKKDPAKGSSVKLIV